MFEHFEWWPILTQKEICVCGMYKQLSNLLLDATICYITNFSHIVSRNVML